MKEDSMSRTMGMLGKNDYAVCFLTAYQRGRPDEENEAANAELARDIRNLGYGFTKIMGGYTYEDEKTGEEFPTSEPGFKVAIKVQSPEDEAKFAEEMKQLGRQYGQETISLKTPNTKTTIYKTDDAHYGDVDMQFDGSKVVNPQDMSTWQGGYTQMAKDAKKNPKRGFSFESGEDDDYLALTEEEYDALPEYNSFSRGKNIQTIEERVLCRLTRGKLGLED